MRNVFNGPGSIRLMLMETIVFGALLLLIVYGIGFAGMVLE